MSVTLRHDHRCRGIRGDRQVMLGGERDQSLGELLRRPIRAAFEHAAFAAGADQGNRRPFDAGPVVDHGGAGGDRNRRHAQRDTVSADSPGADAATATPEHMAEVSI